MYVDPLSHLDSNSSLYISCYMVLWVENFSCLVSSLISQLACMFSIIVIVSWKGTRHVYRETYFNAVFLVV